MSFIVRDEYPVKIISHKTGKTEVILYNKSFDFEYLFTNHTNSELDRARFFLATSSEKQMDENLERIPESKYWQKAKRKLENYKRVIEKNDSIPKRS